MYGRGRFLSETTDHFGVVRWPDAPGRSIGGRRRRLDGRWKDPVPSGYRKQVDVAVSADRSALTGTHPQIRPRCTEHQQYMEGRGSEEADASHPRRSTPCGDECGHGDRISGPAGPALGRFGRSGPAGSRSSRDRVLSGRFRSKAGTRAPDRDGRRIAQVRTGVRWLTLPHPAGHLTRLERSARRRPPSDVVHCQALRGGS